jgi:hypothetical protein
MFWNRVGEALSEKIKEVILPAFLLGAGVAVAITGGQLVENYFFRPKNAPPTLENRIQELTQSLNKSATTIQEIENEITKRQALVTQLQKDAETASKLATVNKEQVDAIAQVLRTQIQVQEHNTFWFNQGINVLYMLLGVGLGELVRWFLRWRARRKARPSAV